MKFTISALAAIVAVASAQYNETAPTSVITIKPGCPTGKPADVMVTRSNVPVPSCEAGKNATKPTIISMSGGAGGMMPTGTGAAGMPQFTGAAGKTAVDSFAAIVGFGVVAALL